MTFMERHSKGVESLTAPEIKQVEDIGAGLTKRGPGTACTWQGLWGLCGLGPIPPKYPQVCQHIASPASGHYADICEEYVKRFGRDRLLLVSFEDLCENTELVVRRVFRFIGADDQVP